MKQSSQELIKFISNISPTCRLLMEKAKELKIQIVDFQEFKKRVIEYYNEWSEDWNCYAFFAARVPEIGFTNNIILSIPAILSVLTEDNGALTKGSKIDPRRIEFYIAHEIGHLIAWNRQPPCQTYWTLCRNGIKIKKYRLCKFSETKADKEALKILNHLCGSVKHWLKVDNLKDAKKFWEETFYPDCVSPVAGCSAPIKPCPKTKETALAFARIKKLFFKDYRTKNDYKKYKKF